MKITKRSVFKRIISFVCILAVCISIIPARPVKAATIGNLALALEAVQELGTSAAKAKIIDFATAAGYTANAEYISASASATLAKGATAALGSITLAILSTVGGAYAGTSYAYEQTSDGFKARFSYEECLQYLWKKAMGSDDETLLAFLYASMDPENIEGLASGSLTFSYDFELSRAVAYTMYDAYFNASPIYSSNFAMEHYGPNPFEYSDLEFIASGWSTPSYLPADSFFPAETYLAGAIEYINTVYPDFNVDFCIMSPGFMLEYGERYEAKLGYNGATTIIAHDFPEGATPIYLYNQTTGRSYLTTFENPQYGLDQSYTTARIQLIGFTYPSEYTSDYYQYGIYFHDSGALSDKNISSNSMYNTPSSYGYYSYDDGADTRHVLYPAEYGHFVNRLGFDQYSIYRIPVYTMDDSGNLLAYDLKAEQALSSPETVAPPSEDAGYNSTIPENSTIMNAAPSVDPYVDAEGGVVSVSDTAEELDPEPTPSPTPPPPVYDDGTPIFPVFPDFSGLGDIPSIFSGFSVFTTFLASCMEMMPPIITDAFWWIFLFLVAIALISVLL